IDLISEVTQCFRAVHAFRLDLLQPESLYMRSRRLDLSLKIVAGDAQVVTRGLKFLQDLGISRIEHVAGETYQRFAGGGIQGGPGFRTERTILAFIHTNEKRGEIKASGYEKRMSRDLREVKGSHGLHREQRSVCHSRGQQLVRFRC